MTLKRVHDTGTETIIRQLEDSAWSIQIVLKEPNKAPVTMIGYGTPSLELAKELAEKELLKWGHVCNRSCREWVEFLG